MTVSSSERMGAACGILYVVLVYVGSSLGVPGSAVGTVLVLLSFLLFLVVLESLWSAMRRAEGGNGWLSTTAFGAGLMSITIGLGTVLGLMEQGKTIGPLPKNPLQTAVLAREIASWVVLGPVEKTLLAPLFALAFVGGLFGYKARYP